MALRIGFILVQYLFYLGSVKRPVPFIEMRMNLFILTWLRLAHRGVKIKLIAENPRSTPEVDGGGIKRENLNNFILSGNQIKHPELHMFE